MFLQMTMWKPMRARKNERERNKRAREKETSNKTKTVQQRMGLLLVTFLQANPHPQTRADKVANTHVLECP